MRSHHGGDALALIDQRLRLMSRVASLTGLRLRSESSRTIACGTEGAFASGGARFFRRPLVARAFLMDGPAASSCDLMLRAAVHRRKAPVTFLHSVCIPSQTGPGFRQPSHAGRGAMVNTTRYLGLPTQDINILW